MSELRVTILKGPKEFHTLVWLHLTGWMVQREKLSEFLKEDQIKKKYRSSKSEKKKKKKEKI